MKQCQTMQNGFWDNIEKWRKLPAAQLDWRDGWLQNGYCAACQLCCGPQGKNDPPFPMPLLPSQVDAETPENFYLLDENTPYIGAKGCKSATSAGCRLPLEKKPIACGLFPLVLINGKLYLYQNCPAVLFTPLLRFLEFAEEAAKNLHKYSLTELERLSISLPCEIIAAKYIDLYITIFDSAGKTLRKE